MKSTRRSFFGGILAAAAAAVGIGKATETVVPMNEEQKRLTLEAIDEAGLAVGERNRQAVDELLDYDDDLLYLPLHPRVDMNLYDGPITPVEALDIESETLRFGEEHVLYEGPRMQDPPRLVITDIDWENKEVTLSHLQPGEMRPFEGSAGPFPLMINSAVPKNSLFFIPRNFLLSEYVEPKSALLYNLKPPEGY